MPVNLICTRVNRLAAYYYINRTPFKHSVACTTLPIFCTNQGKCLLQLLILKQLFYTGLIINPFIFSHINGFVNTHLCVHFQSVDYLRKDIQVQILSPPQKKAAFTGPNNADALFTLNKIRVICSEHYTYQCLVPA